MAHIGFAKLSAQLGARKGKEKASNPDALAAYIGRKKFGAKGMIARSVASKKHSK